MSSLEKMPVTSWKLPLPVHSFCQIVSWNAYLMGETSLRPDYSATGRAIETNRGRGLVHRFLQNE